MYQISAGVAEVGNRLDGMIVTFREKLGVGSPSDEAYVPPAKHLDRRVDILESKLDQLLCFFQGDEACRVISLIDKLTRISLQVGGMEAKLDEIVAIVKRPKEVTVRCQIESNTTGQGASQVRILVSCNFTLC